MAHLICWALWAFLGIQDSFHAWAAETRSTLLSTEAIQTLSLDEANKGWPVQLTGVVTFSNSEWRMLFVEDETGGIYCEADPAPGFPPPGTSVSVEGFTLTGSFLPIVHVTRVVTLGPGAFPRPRLVAASELWQGRYDADFVRVDGVVVRQTRHQTFEGLARLELHLFSGGAFCVAQVFHPPGETMSAEIGSYVAVEGVFAPAADANRQIQEVTLLVAQRTQVHALTNAATFTDALPTSPLPQLSPPRLSTTTNAIRVEGIVTYVDEGEVWLQQGESGLGLRLPPGQNLEKGESLQVLAIPLPGKLVPNLQLVRLASRQSGKLPPPIHLQVSDLSNWDRFGQFVQCEGSFLHRIRDPDGDLMVLADEEEHTFTARLHPEMSSSLRELAAGTRVAVRGVLKLSIDAPEALPIPTILVASAGDWIRLTSPPWPMRRTLTVVSSLSVALGLGLLALAISYRRQRDSNERVEAAEHELRGLNSELEKRIRIRTAELEKANAQLKGEVTERRLAETLRSEQAAILERIAQGAPLAETLERVVRAVEAQAEGLVCSVLLLDQETGRLRLGAAPSLPEAYNRKLDGIAIGPCVGSCGTAAFRGEPVIVEDIQTDPLWQEYRPLVAPTGLRACWSTPILDAQRRVLGTFACYYSQPMRPPTRHWALVQTATHTAAIGIQHDRATRELRASEAALRHAQSIAQVGSWELDVERDTLTGSPEALRICGLGPGPHPSSKVQALVPEAQQARVLGDWRAAIAGDSLDVEHQIVVGDETRWIHVRAFPERDAAGKIVRLRGVAQDITERKNAQVERARLETQLRQAQKLEALGTLAGGIAHDFNNILGAILGCTELALMDVGDNRPVTENLEDIRKAGQRARELVKQILTFSRRQEGQRRPIAVGAVVDESLRLLRATLPATLRLTSNVAPSLPTILGNATLLQQVIMNLVTNSAAAIGDRPGEVAVRVDSCDLERETTAAHPLLRPGPHVRLVVQDDGPGIEPALQERIFEPFFTTKGPGKGTGLGLAVVHGIVQAHQGAIELQSRPGAGTTMTLYFPAATGGAVGADGEITAQPPAPTSTGLRGRERILLVDDEPALLAVTERILRGYGYRVVPCRDPLEAWERFRTQPEDFDVVITDYWMPGRNGVELGRQILALRPQVPVILCTGHGGELDRGSALALGFRAFLEKPVDFNELARAIRSFFDVGTSPPKPSGEH